MKNHIIKYLKDVTARNLGHTHVPTHGTLLLEDLYDQLGQELFGKNWTNLECFICDEAKLNVICQDVDSYGMNLVNYLHSWCLIPKEYSWQSLNDLTQLRLNKKNRGNIELILNRLFPKKALTVWLEKLMETIGAGDLFFTIILNIKNKEQIELNREDVWHRTFNFLTRSLSIKNLIESLMFSKRLIPWFTDNVSGVDYQVPQYCLNSSSTVTKLHFNIETSQCWLKELLANPSDPTTFWPRPREGYLYFIKEEVISLLRELSHNQLEESYALTTVTINNGLSDLDIVNEFVKHGYFPEFLITSFKAILHFNMTKEAPRPMSKHIVDYVLNVLQLKTEDGKPAKNLARNIATATRLNEDQKGGNQKSKINA